MLRNTNTFIIKGGNVLLSDGTITKTDLRVSDGLIDAIGIGTVGKSNVLDASGFNVLPGAIDLHGDAFEHQIMPRAGVSFPMDMALFETDRQLVSNGITTAFHGITYSWEPGLRSRDVGAELIECLERLRSDFGCSTKFHLRFETYNLDAINEVEKWLESERVDFLAFNESRNPKNPRKKKCRKCSKSCPNEIKMVKRQMAPGFVVQQQQEVPSDEYCKNEKKKLTGAIEKGMPNDSKITFERESEQRPGYIPGDVIMIVRTRKHRTYQRKGNDLHHTMKISLREALTGFSKTLHHLDNHQVTISSQKVIKPFQVKKYTGEGMPIHNFPSTFGDLYVKFEIIFPKTISEADQLKLKDILK